jgi:hypothetical protein
VAAAATLAAVVDMVVETRVAMVAEVSKVVDKNS